ncbi:CD320 antigen [Varanus komodoensis]|uniref:CD320 antigen n=1 Tax=Varanus komodoensis TaxID=61221 RepID=UPI001CF76E7C|nr:CD320 antigen [Varanus komodoensis]
MERLLFFAWLLLLELAVPRGLGAAETGSFLCSLGRFQCLEGSQVPLCSRCDGQPDCKDGSDERSCHKGNVSCGRRGKQCGAGGPCLPWERFCDGHRDCLDGSDESADACGHPTALSAACPAGYFRCAPGSPCYTLAWVCDGHADCLDERDERGCSSDVSPETSQPPDANHTESTVAPEISYKKETAIAEILLLPLLAATALVLVVLIMMTFIKAEPFSYFMLDKVKDRLMLEAQP